jgi:hypothetical protein
VNKADIYRVVQLQRAVQGKPTDRKAEDILAGERLVAKKYVGRVPITGRVGKLTSESEASTQ